MSKLSIYILEGQELIRQPRKNQIHERTAARIKGSQQRAVDPGDDGVKKYGWIKLFRGKCIGNKHLASQNLHPFPHLFFYMRAACKSFG